MKDKGKLVIWPVYIDGTKSRGEGRIISQKDSVKSPELKEIETAALKLGLNPVVETEKAYPRSWWEWSGRVLVDDRGPKSMMARQIAVKIRDLREKK